MKQTTRWQCRQQNTVFCRNLGLKTQMFSFLNDQLDEEISLASIYRLFLVTFASPVKVHLNTKTHAVKPPGHLIIFFLFYRSIKTNVYDVTIETQ